MKTIVRFYKSRLLQFLVFLLLIAVDQVSKTIVSTLMRINESIEFFNGYCGIRYVTNRGLARGILSELHPLGPILIFLFLIFIFFTYRSYQKTASPMRLSIFAYILIMSGGIGNLIDQVVLGYARDFIIFFKLSVANIADFYWYTGIFIVYLILIKDKNLRGARG